MLDSSEIYHTLDSLIDEYDNSSITPKEKYLSAKLSIIEVCGWIEECMDRLVLDAPVLDDIRDDNRKIVKDQVKHIHGFSYENHFKHLLICLIGCVGVNSLEDQIDSYRFHQMISDLNSLRAIRNELAHTSYAPNRSSLDAPATVRTRFDGVRKGLEDIEAALQLLANRSMDGRR